VKQGVEFVARLGKDGKLVVPPSVLTELGPLGRAALEVRLTERRLSRELSRRRISDGEIDRIASVQLDSRERVIRFLLAEGSLWRRRAKSGRRKG